MPTEIYIPKMSDHMESGTILRWLVTDGERVQKGQVLLELETDKAVGEIEAPDSGVLRVMRAGEGTEVPVGEIIAYILQPGEPLPSSPRQDQPNPQPRVQGRPEATPAPGPSTSPTPDEGHVLAAPAARRVARELGIDLRNVKGTGPGGRIKEEDVRAYVEKHKDRP
jgi:pyruvate dehydrogenase E2 component (dihydrolipoamide acetyltransferase)